jgi:hypothetical protein
VLKFGPPRTPDAAAAPGRVTDGYLDEMVVRIISKRRDLSRARRPEGKSSM